MFFFFVGFTKWLNFVLTPPDVSDSAAQVDIHKGYNRKESDITEQQLLVSCGVVLLITLFARYRLSLLE